MKDDILSLKVSAFIREKEFDRRLQDHKYVVAFVEPVKTNVLMDKFVIIRVTPAVSSTEKKRSHLPVKITAMYFNIMSA